MFSIPLQVEIRFFPHQHLGDGLKTRVTCWFPFRFKAEDCGYLWPAEFAALKSRFEEAMGGFSARAPFNFDDADVNMEGSRPAETLSVAHSFLLRGGCGACCFLFSFDLSKGFAITPWDYVLGELPEVVRTAIKFHVETALNCEVVILGCPSTEFWTLCLLQMPFRKDSLFPHSVQLRNL